eukprot:TRINITY_DN628_c1_g6_i1.p1 TRINITY_DN628_c1_g6~~TRINITY_DN628_c1_g6_i1.p1  ORF type:complete len:562 (+),score=236.53 TRINITY_DN628_c1_g6_i1:48-1688(+)
MQFIKLITIFLLITFIINLKNINCQVPTTTFATVYFDGQNYNVQFGILDSKGVAYGSFIDGETITGWGVLQIETSSTFTDQQQMYGAGFLEAALTKQRMFEMFSNINDYFFGKQPPPSALQDFFTTQENWAQQNSQKNNSIFWNGYSLIQSQFNGLIDAYNKYSDPTKVLSRYQLQILNAMGDLLDLLPAIDQERRTDWFKLTPEEFYRIISENGHCSAIIKVPGDFSDVFSSHSSWFTYQAMNRIYKHYSFNLKSPTIAAKQTSFSSYPGVLSSLDDFYLLSSKMVMLQTTNSIFNHSLYSLVVPQSLFAWQRVRIANLLANNGKEWAEAVAQYNSGTYNNQYMILDNKQIELGKQLHNGTLWVVEQIPGLVQSGDKTDVLAYGYWPSYNVPSFENIYEISGYPEIVKRYGPSSSYQFAPRATLFRRDQSKVQDLDSLKQLMRSNDYKNDPYANDDPGKAICSRFDLESNNPSPSGCYDTKATTYKNSLNLISDAINGPTTENGLPPFSWTGTFENVLHEGQPKVFNFEFQQMNPNWSAFKQKLI